MEKMLHFQLRGDYGHFKKYYTTTSPLTFEMPPPPTVMGIISAIIGLDKQEYLYAFSDPGSYQIAVRLGAPVKKVRMSLNLINTKIHFWRIKNRTQIRTEFLKNPLYHIYFSHADMQLYQSLKERLKTHTSVYTVSLGLSQLLGNIQFMGEKEMTMKKGEDVIPVHSVIPRWKKTVKSIEYPEGAEIFSVNYPLHMTPERVVDDRDVVLFDRNGHAIHCIPDTYCQLETGENIVLF